MVHLCPIEVLGTRAGARPPHDMEDRFLANVLLVHGTDLKVCDLLKFREVLAIGILCGLGGHLLLPEEILQVKEEG